MLEDGNYCWYIVRKTVRITWNITETTGASHQFHFFICFCWWASSYDDTTLRGGRTICCPANRFSRLSLPVDFEQPVGFPMKLRMTKQWLWSCEAAHDETMVVKQWNEAAHDETMVVKQWSCAWRNTFFVVTLMCGKLQTRLICTGQQGCGAGAQGISDRWRRNQKLFDHGFEAGPWNFGSSS